MAGKPPTRFIPPRPELRPPQRYVPSQVQRSAAQLQKSPGIAPAPYIPPPPVRNVVVPRPGQFPGAPRIPPPPLPAVAQPVRALPAAVKPLAPPITRSPIPVAQRAPVAGAQFRNPVVPRAPIPAPARCGAAIQPFPNWLRKLLQKLKPGRAAAPVAVVPPAQNVPPPVSAVEPLRTRSPLSPVRDDYAQDGNYSLEQLREHLTAYEKARYYHATKDKNVASILKGGLSRDYGGSQEGASATADPGSRQGNVGRVFVGGDRETALYYERQLRSDKTATPETLRVFMTPDATETLAPDFGDSDNEAYWTAEHDVPANQILSGKFANASREQLMAVFDVVRRNYPNPETITTEEVIERHFEAIARGLTVHRKRPGRLQRGRFIRDVTNPSQGGFGSASGYESD